MVGCNREQVEVGGWKKEGRWDLVVERGCW